MTQKVVKTGTGMHCLHSKVQYLLSVVVVWNTPEMLDTFEQFAVEGKDWASYSVSQAVQH